MKICESGNLLERLVNRFRYIHGKMYEVKSDICFFVAMRPKKSSGGETLLQKKQMSVCLFAEKMCPQKQDYLQGDIIDGDRHRPAA